ncbi:carcinoembryonic antigen-related cell adhesion molecule 21-like [Carlito syrichta]|uniref:Carcinoembryonic antigen-related cell adhesion molecule 21-like n=1 Tax=Carlito syrichta TaxID=1868482 RepID=A0A3Q0DHB7_CARSF|nr:carcinoembryonic antigen-related cell adhesion molecule 21-like [Carlito syrichta]
MAPYTTLPHRGHVPWQGLLLTASLLTFWNPPTTAQVMVESVPFNVAEGKDVLLLVHNLPQNVAGYVWYKGEGVEASNRIVAYVISTQVHVLGPAHSGRETIYPNGSLLFQNVTQEDTGYYTLHITNRMLQTYQATGQFHVHRSVAQPLIRASSTTIMESEGPVLLACHTNDAATFIQWIFNNQTMQVTERTRLIWGHRVVIIAPVKREDAGEYQCRVSNLVSSSQSDPFMLNVKYKASKSLPTS